MSTSMLETSVTSLRHRDGLQTRGIFAFPHIFRGLDSKRETLPHKLVPHINFVAQSVSVVAFHLFGEKQRKRTNLCSYYSCHALYRSKCSGSKPINFLRFTIARAQTSFHGGLNRAPTKRASTWEVELLSKSTHFQYRMHVNLNRVSWRLLRRCSPITGIVVSPKLRLPHPPSWNRGRVLFSAVWSVDFKALIVHLL